MTVHIDQAVTEVVAEPEVASAAGDSGDKRWQEQQKLKAALARYERMRLRVAAGGFDD
ncbi:MAG: hypothetical protein GXP10_08125 [Gammaproteobacteria bacterium]|nr:hypothetical protein [Gammaproteobacteria bacterium]